MGQAILLLRVRSAERISDDIPASSTDDTPPPVCETAKSSAAQMHAVKRPAPTEAIASHSDRR